MSELGKRHIPYIDDRQGGCNRDGDDRLPRGYRIVIIPGPAPHIFIFSIHRHIAEEISLICRVVFIVGVGTSIITVKKNLFILHMEEIREADIIISLFEKVRKVNPLSMDGFILVPLTGAFSS